jgi:hypothetical protein
MSDFSLNQQVIAEFRANEGRVGGYLEGSLVVLVHHRGRLSGRGYVHPMIYLADPDDHDTIYVFATNSGAPSNPPAERSLAGRTGAGSSPQLTRGLAEFRLSIGRVAIPAAAVGS